jgi:hypothetical protein
MGWLIPLFCMGTRPLIRTGIRTAVAVAAVYAFIFNALLSAAAPVIASPTAGVSICGHDADGSDQPLPAAPVHHDVCCLAVCGPHLAVLAPSNYSQFLLLPADILLPTNWSVELGPPAILRNDKPIREVLRRSSDAIAFPIRSEDLPMAYLPYPHGLYHRFLRRRAAAAAAGLVAAKNAVAKRATPQ